MIPGGIFGIFMRSNSGVSADSLNAADNRVAFSFFAPATTTVTKVIVGVYDVTGSLQVGDLKCQIFDDSGIKPNAQITNGLTTTSAPTTPAAGWIEFTFGTPAAVTGGTRYWIVLSNANIADPTANFMRIRRLNDGPFPYPTLAGSSQFSFASSTNAGVAWGSQSSNVTSFRIEFGNGYNSGFTPESQDYESTNVVYGTSRECGVYFTIPASWPTVNVRSVQFCVAAVGTPSTARIRLYNNLTLLGTTPVLPVAQFDGNKPIFHKGVFTTVQALTPGMIVRAVMGATGGTAGNEYQIIHYTGYENAANARACLPLGGWQQTFSSDSGASFAQDNALVPIVTIELDPVTPFTVSSGGGFPIIGTGLVGGS